jgi:hypothetical protein
MWRAMSSTVETAGKRSFGRAWLVWLICTLLVVGYVWIARIESQSTVMELELRPGNEIDLTVFRVFDDVLDAGLTYRENCPASTSWGSDVSRRTTRQVVPGFWVYTPDTLVRLELRSADQQPILLEAVPDGRECGPLFRHLTTNLSIAPGLYQRPSTQLVQQIPLRRFRNRLHIRVADVDPQAWGKKVNVVVIAPLGFNQYQPGLGVFWFAFFLEPIFWVTQSVWAGALLLRSGRIRLRRWLRPQA